MIVQDWILSDDPQLIRRVCDVLDRESRTVTTCRSPDQVDLLRLAPGRHHQILIDLRTVDAPEYLERLRSQRARSEVRTTQVVGIFERGYRPESAVLADQVLDAAICVSQLERGLAEILRANSDSPRLSSRDSFDLPRVMRAGTCEIVTGTPAQYTLLDTLEMAAGQDLSVLFVGETGTGKTTLASMIHHLSPRRKEPFLAISCAAFSNELIGSELFGHTKGAFTGADREKIGKFEAAGRGTILLDEIDLLSHQQQANLLRVLESGEFERVGSNETRRTRARTIVASNVCLKSMVDQGEFRIDLYYRLDQVKFDIPPLRERPRDIVPLAVHFINECCSEEGVQVNVIELDFLKRIKSYDWPGNIRQLRNEVRRAVLFCKQGVLTCQLLSKEIVDQPVPAESPGTGQPAHDRLVSNVARTERDAITSALNFHDFNRAAAARALGISRVTLYNKMRKYKIRVDRAN